MALPEECGMFSGIDWTAFPKPLSGLSVRARERLMLAALWESEEALYWPEGVDALLAHAVSALCREHHEDALFLGALLPAAWPVEQAVRLEQLQADLTAALERVPGTQPLRPALSFFLVEDTDRLYRFANLLDAEQERSAESLLDGLCEITPGRPCAAAHRDPADFLFEELDFERDACAACLSAVLLGGVKRQAARVYTACAASAGEAFRPMFAEAALLLQEQSIAYSSLWDSRLEPAQRLLWRGRAARYLFASLYAAERDERLKSLWSDLLDRRAEQVRRMAALCGCTEEDVLPPLFVLRDHSEMARTVLERQATLTRLREALIPVEQMPPNQAYFAHQRRWVGDGRALPSHCAVQRYIERYGTDYRFERRRSALEALHDRTCDNLTLARGAAGENAIFCAKKEREKLFTD